MSTRGLSPSPPPPASCPSLSPCLCIDSCRASGRWIESATARASFATNRWNSFKMLKFRGGGEINFKVKFIWFSTDTSGVCTLPLAGSLESTSDAADQSFIRPYPNKSCDELSRVFPLSHVWIENYRLMSNMLVYLPNISYFIRKF